MNKTICNNAACPKKGACSFFDKNPPKNSFQIKTENPNGCDLFKEKSDLNIEDLFGERKLNLTCRTCENRQRWTCNSKTFHYCGIRKSNRTNNGLLKIRCKDRACILYKPEQKRLQNDTGTNT